MNPSCARSVSLAAAAAIFCVSSLLAATPSPDVLAVVAGKPITRADVEAAAGPRLTEVRNQEYTVLRQALDEIINRTLLTAEAARRKLDVKALVQQEVDSKAAPVTAEETKKIYDENKAQFGTMAEAEALTNIQGRLKEQHMRARGIEYVGTLRTAAGVKVSLEPPRFPVSATTDDPAKGPADAPVTLVEFSDFECPFCSRVVPTLRQIEERYGKKVRIVFRDLPLVQIHKHAAKAAEAGACAHEQGKFWEMHDRLFANQAALSVDDLKKTAAEIGLDAKAFDTCLDSGRFANEWKEDSEVAASYGISGTPAFLVNGRMLSGAQPFENFARIIDEELERGGQPLPVATAPLVAAPADVK